MGDAGRVSTAPPVTVRPIRTHELAEVGRFLHSHLNRKLSAQQWAKSLRPTWSTEERDHGFLLRAGDDVVGVYAAFYAHRQIDGRPEKLCNLAAWCVVEEHRGHGLRLLRAMLAQPGYTFTDLSPSGNVVPLNERLGFVHLDTSGALVVNLPWSSRGRVVTDGESVEAVLGERERQIHRDHARAAAARHVVIERGGRTCYVVWRRVRRKRLPLFARVLYVSDPETFRSVTGRFGRHLLWRHAIPFVLLERRVGGAPPWHAVGLRSPRPAMVRTSTVEPSEVDYLYSELTCVPW
jgi:hypothetical protein